MRSQSQNKYYFGFLRTLSIIILLLLIHNSHHTDDAQKKDIARMCEKEVDQHSNQSTGCWIFISCFSFSGSFQKTMISDLIKWFAICFYSEMKWKNFYKLWIVQGLWLARWLPGLLSRDELNMNRMVWYGNVIRNRNREYFYGFQMNLLSEWQLHYGFVKERMIDGSFCSFRFPIWYCGFILLRWPLWK